MKTSMKIQVTRVDTETPFRDKINPRDGSLCRREFKEYSIVKGYGICLLSGEVIGPLPIPIGCKVGDVLEVSVSVVNARPGRIEDSVKGVVDKE